MCLDFVITLMKHRRMYFSNSFLDSSPTNAVTGIAASFYKQSLLALFRRVPAQKQRESEYFRIRTRAKKQNKTKHINWLSIHLFFNHPLDKLVVVGFVLITCVWQVLICKNTFKMWRSTQSVQTAAQKHTSKFKLNISATHWERWRPPAWSILPRGRWDSFQHLSGWLPGGPSWPPAPLTGRRSSTLADPSAPGSGVNLEPRPPNGTKHTRCLQ